MKKKDQGGPHIALQHHKKQKTAGHGGKVEQGGEPVDGALDLVKRLGKDEDIGQLDKLRGLDADRAQVNPVAVAVAGRALAKQDGDDNGARRKGVEEGPKVGQQVKVKHGDDKHAAKAQPEGDGLHEKRARQQG